MQFYLQIIRRCGKINVAVYNEMTKSRFSKQNHRHIIGLSCQEKGEEGNKS
jgi:hypothetical protein